MTPHEIDLISALAHCSGWTGSRFITSVAALPGSAELTARQRYYMEILAWRYRRQLPAHLVPDAKPPPLPKKRREPKPQRKRNDRQPQPTPVQQAFEFYPFAS